MSHSVDECIYNRVYFVKFILKNNVPRLHHGTVQNSYSISPTMVGVSIQNVNIATTMANAFVVFKETKKSETKAIPVSVA